MLLYQQNPSPSLLRDCEPNGLVEVKQLMIEWLVNSGVYIRDSHPTAQGGLHAGYNIRFKQWLFVYSEITGYAISMLCMLYRTTEDKNYLDMARKSAAFLIRHQVPADRQPAGGSFPQGLTVPGFRSLPDHYTFDAAMCIQGLMDLYRITGEETLLESAKAGGDWLISMQDSTGFFYAHYDSESGSCSHPGPYFHQDGGCQHAKHAVALLKLYRVTKNEKYQRAARKVCDWVLSLQDEDGAFWANRTRSHVYAHAHCYATEGLLYAFNEMRIPTYEVAVRHACNWLDVTIDKRYGLLGTHKISSGFQPTEAITSRRLFRFFRSVVPRRESATDATLQSARLFIYRSIQGADEQGLDKATRIVEILLPRVLNQGSNPCTRGGLHARFDISFGWARPSPIIATWGVLFGVNTYLLLELSTKSQKSSSNLDELF